MVCLMEGEPTGMEAALSCVSRRWTLYYLKSCLRFLAWIPPRAGLCILLLSCGGGLLQPVYRSVLAATDNLCVGPALNDLLKNNFPTTGRANVIYDIRHITVPSSGSKGFVCAWGMLAGTGATEDDPEDQWGQIWEIDIDTRIVTVLCGSEKQGQSIDGNVTTAAFFGPIALAVAADMSELYVLEHCTNMIRAVNLTSPEKNTRPLVKLGGSVERPIATFYNPGDKVNASQAGCNTVLLAHGSTMVFDASKETFYVSTRNSIMEIDLRNRTISTLYNYVLAHSEPVGFSISGNGSSLIAPDIDLFSMLRFGLHRKHQEVIVGINASTLAGNIPYSDREAIPFTAAYYPSDNFLAIGTMVVPLQDPTYSDLLVQLVTFDAPDGKVVDVSDTNAQFKRASARGLAFMKDGAVLIIAVRSSKAGESAQLWLCEIDPAVLSPVIPSSSLPLPASSSGLLPTSSISLMPSSSPTFATSIFHAEASTNSIDPSSPPVMSSTSAVMSSSSSPYVSVVPSPALISLTASAPSLPLVTLTTILVPCLAGIVIFITLL